MVRAQRFELVDAMGRVRAVLALDATANPVFEMLDNEGQRVFVAPPEFEVRMLGE